MAMLHDCTAPNGVPVGFHRIARVETTADLSGFVASVASWPTAQHAVDGAQPAWLEPYLLPLDVAAQYSAANVLDAMEAWLLAGPFDGGQATADVSQGLDALKRRKVLRLRAQRDAFVRAGFVWDGSMFDSDDASQQRLLGAMSAAQAGLLLDGVSWRLFDNSWRHLSASDLAGVYQALTLHVQSAFEAFRLVEADVAAAVTPEEVESIVWTGPAASST